ncbi:MAG: SDR family NAD(P)-dependent oxidoreductase [Myxococcota bacterium]
MSLVGKVVLITGGGQGIGASCAQLFAEQGARIAVSARSIEKLEEVAASLRAKGAECLPVACDVTDSDQVDKMVQTVRETLGPIDILIANAGIAASAPVVKTDNAMWDRIIATNLSGSFYCMRAVLPDMLKSGWGRIIVVASDAGKVGFQYTAAYCASKHGVIGLVRSLALEVAQRGITVNAICPGFVETPMAWQSIDNIVLKSRKTPEQARAYLESLSPQNRLFMPEEVAAMALFLSTEGARGIHGQSIPLDGGTVQS